MRLEVERATSTTRECTLSAQHGCSCTRIFTVEELGGVLYLIEEGFLEEDENLNNKIADIAIEVSRDEENPAGFECNVCGKACKSHRL